MYGCFDIKLVFNGAKHPNYTVDIKVIAISTVRPQQNAPLEFHRTLFQRCTTYTILNNPQIKLVATLRHLRPLIHPQRIVVIEDVNFEVSDLDLFNDCGLLRSQEALEVLGIRLADDVASRALA